MGTVARGLRQRCADRAAQHGEYPLHTPNDESFLAMGHDRQGRATERLTWSAPSAASSLYTTASDYERFLSAMLAGLVVDEHDVPAQLVDPQVEVDGAVGLYWGLGWAVAQEVNDTVFLLWSSNPGYKSLAVGSVIQCVAMVVLMNGDNGLFDYTLVRLMYC